MIAVKTKKSATTIYMRISYNMPASYNMCTFMHFFFFFQIALVFHPNIVVNDIIYVLVN